MLSCSRRRKTGPYAKARLLALSTLGLTALGLASAAPPASAQVPVLTQNRDNTRSGANLVETTLTPAAVASGNFGKLFTITGLNANVNGQPLFAPRVTINNVTRNVLVAYTSNNTDNSPCGLYAFDADTGSPLWATILPNSATYTTATPVIDPVTNTIYVLTKTGNDDTGLTYLHAFDLTTGRDKPGSPVQVQASAPGTGDGSVGGTVYFDGDHGNGRFHANDRVGLLLLNGVVYAGFAHNSDSNPYHGWILGYAYNGSTFTQQYVFCTTPNGSSRNTPGGADGGVWQAGKGLTADAQGNIYFTTGNGTFDANNGGVDYGMCYLKLSPSLQVEDYFSPYDEAGQSANDLDIGNSGITGIPGTTRLFGGGTKFGAAFLLDSNSMGRFTPNGPDAILDRINGVSGNDDVGQNSIAWNTGDGAAKYVYLWPGGRGVEQFDYSPATGNFSPAGIAKQNAALTSGGSLAVSSNGGSGGILWAAGNNGTLYALNAADVSQAPLWSGSFGSSGHFQFPTVTDGKVYVPTGGNSNSIVVFGLANPPTPTGASGVTQIRFAARPGFESRMVGGQFQGSSDGVNYATLATVTATPTDGLTNTLPVSNPNLFRYLRYLSPSGGHGNIAEVEFDGGSAAAPVKLVGVPFGTPGSWHNLGNDYAQVFDGDPTTAFDAPDPGDGDFVGLDLGPGSVTPQPTLLQINAGGGAAGAFAADGGYSGGGTYATGAAISTAGVTNPAPQAVYQTERYGNFTYAVPNLTPGAAYTLRLHFAEIYWNSAGQRLFNVSVNGSQVLTDFDVFAAAGGKYKAVVESLPVTADVNGKITVTFSTLRDNAKVSGIEVIGGAVIPPVGTPVSEVNAGGGVAGAYGADAGFSGGVTAHTTAAIATAGVTDPAPQAVYQTERYGNFTYAVPNLTPGAAYTLRLHFAEIYWNSAGKRLFNVSVNGSPFLTNFDVFAAAGGKDKAIVESLPVTADGNGRVTVTFTTLRDNAKVSGIELTH